MATVASYIYIPSSSYTTAQLECATMKSVSGSLGVTHAELKFGSNQAGSAYTARGIITIRLPELFDVFGDSTSKFFNSNTPELTITDLMLKLNIDTVVSNVGKYVVYFVKKAYREHQFGVFGTSGTGTPHITKYVKPESYSWKGYSKAQMGYNSYEETHTSGNLYWKTPGGFVQGDPELAATTSNPDIDQTTDYGHGPNGIIHAFTAENATANADIPLAPLVASKSLTWGDTFAVMIKHEGAYYSYRVDGLAGTIADFGSEAQLGVETLQTCTATTFGGLVTSSEAALAITYTDDVPTKPIITLTADTDYITPIVKFTSFPSDADIQTVQLRYNTTSYAAIDTTDSGVSLSNFNLEEYKDLKDTTFLDTANSSYYLTAISQDNTSYIKGNPIVKKRMNCSGSLSAGTAIGTELTLTVTGLVGDYSGKFIKYGVNWDGDGTPANDSLSDYNIVTLDEEATTATITHTFDKSIGGNYNVNIFTIDRDGFRSNFTAGDTVNIAAGTPVAKLNASRDSLVRGTYGDDFSVCTLSGAHSYAVGSNRKIRNHGFQHGQTNRSTPVSTSPMENDNSNFNSVSKKIKLKCNHGGCVETIVKVFGRVSVDDAGGDDADNTTDFDHYEMQAITLSPSDSVDSFGSLSDEYFKSVDFVAITTLGADDGAVTGTHYTLADSGGNLINNQIRGTPSDWMWGGYAVGVSTGNIAFTAATKRITRSSGSWIADGFAVGDRIYCEGPDVAANNRYFTVNTITTTILTVDETVTEDGTDGAVLVYKINGPTLTFTCMDENAPTITHIVTDTHNIETADTTTSATSSTVTQSITFESEVYHTLDLDTQSDSGNIAILNSQFKRSGGVQGIMALGNRRYPIGTTRTRLGNPTLTLSVRVLNQAGYRNLWNLIEGDRYNWATIDSKKVDSPNTAYKQVRMRLLDGTLTKDPSMASQYTASLNFIVIGELVT